MADIFISENEIKTDESVWNFKDEQNESYVVFENEMREQTIPYRSGDYANIYLRRSFFTKYSRRQFTKIDIIMAYIGGFLQIFLNILGCICKNLFLISIIQF